MRIRASILALGLTLATSCWGPDAPDADVCRDVIHRLCLPELCTAASLTFNVGTNCEADLQARTGCFDDAFVFPNPPTRDRVLECRLALVRQGTDRNQHPDCLDVDDFVGFCPDVTNFFAGVP